MPGLDRAFLLLPPAALLLLYTLFSDDMGIRYLIPALPFLHLVGGLGARTLWDSGSILKRAGLLVLCLWLAGNALGIAPDHLSFFNESACLFAEPSRLGLDAGSACGPLWLDDSNVDWGQGVKQLAAWLRQRAPGRRIGLGYFGTGSPEADGVEFDRLSLLDIKRGLPPGLHAISTHLVARARGALTAKYGSAPANWLLHVEPTAVVGHAYYVYDLRAVP
jgi:hypothetical protein